MSDLISRSELINVLKVHFDSCFREDGELLYSDHICTSDDVVDLIKLVENQPTAYSVAKVVTELNELDVTAIRRYEGGAFGNYEGTDYYIEKSKAIEIVKHGGVSDDVCEWHGEQSRLVTYTNFTTACGYSFDLQTNNELLKAFRYCPFCGKKIRMVE